MLFKVPFNILMSWSLVSASGLRLQILAAPKRNVKPRDFALLYYGEPIPN